MIAECSLAQAAHAWGAHGIPFNGEPKSPQINDQKRDKILDELRIFRQHLRRNGSAS
jgi:hypothetical protein